MKPRRCAIRRRCSAAGTRLSRRRHAAVRRARARQRFNSDGSSTRSAAFVIDRVCFRDDAYMCSRDGRLPLSCWRSVARRKSMTRRPRPIANRRQAALPATREQLHSRAVELQLRRGRRARRPPEPRQKVEAAAHRAARARRAQATLAAPDPARVVVPVRQGRAVRRVPGNIDEAGRHQVALRGGFSGGRRRERLPRVERVT